MIVRRIISLLSAVLFAASALSAAAAAEGVRFTVKSAAKPTVSEYGYSVYAAVLDQTVDDRELGAIYTPESTTFRLWTPAASSVSVNIYTTGSDAEAGARTISSNPMTYSDYYGTWSVTLKGDYKNYYYTYLVTVGDTTCEVVDPYAKAVGVNGNRGMIVELSDTDPDGWADDSFTRVDSAGEAIVWEVSVRDFSASESSGVSLKNRGKYLAFTELNTTLNSEGDIPTCVAYLRDLGVNYVQINPFYDFASIDEGDTLSEQYNWGYDPKNYNAPEGSYSSNPYDGRVRISECKQMIRALHDAGIGVIMDVVYNHTYYSEDSFFNQIAPYYYYRMNEDGSWSNGSGCGNDVATERYMVRRFIVDSVRYWAQEYHIDGFRFDLMGLMDVDTMNKIRKELDQLPDGEKILMYGEAWKLNTSAPADVKLANQDNMNLLSDRIGAFSDATRDAIKGSVFNLKETGFVQEGKSKAGIRAAIDGDGGGWATVPNQVVNYASCHDNVTLYDKLTGSVYKDENYQMRREDLLAMNKLSAAIILMSRGMPFMLAGEEMARTKLGDGNSYISPIEINRIDWNLLTKYTSLVDYYRGLIAIRKAVGVMSDPTGSGSQITYLEVEGKGAIAFTAEGEGLGSVTAVFNGNPNDSVSVILPEGEWVILADGDRAGLRSLGTVEGVMEVGSTCAAVLIPADSYAQLTASGDEAVLYFRYVDNKTSDVLLEQRATGAIGGSYSMTAPDDILFRYDISDTKAHLDGEFSLAYDVIDILCEPYEGTYTSVTFRFTDNFDRMLADSISVTGRTGQQYYSPAIPEIPGYRLDLSRLPANAAGVFPEEDGAVDYHFIPDDGMLAPDGSVGNCRANLIYLGSDGRILGVDTVWGLQLDRITVTAPAFSGYEFHAVSDGDTYFSDTEVNLIVSYQKKSSNPLPYILCTAAAVILIICLGAFLSGRNAKRRKIRAINLDE